MLRTPLCLALLLALAACDEAPQQTPTPDQNTAIIPGQAPTAAPPTAEAKNAPAAGEILVDPGAEEPEKVTKAIAVIHPLGDGKTKGTVELEETDGGLKLKATIEGLPDGKHAYHVHLLGDCSAPNGESAGTHFHFTGPSKEPPADIKIITGNFGDLEANAEGKATHEATIENAKLHGPYSILGRSVIIHEKPNDPKDPPIGGAGGRIACGVIGIDE
jgi:superoxide dismutase, Cu-Zn family